ncbi:MAG TPA: succinylglutamate desuccinylase/aspartoacylase family protein [Candidatus Megaira endosymbiont of Hartmannula sinica]|nr:succinylglutamate desuccinylase/aspartoacylase family protein [Candidatus Megaera endosymbiont of Hartmannula sinica]
MFSWIKKWFSCKSNGLFDHREYSKKAHYGIDLHTGSGGRSNYPQIRAVINSHEMEDLARSFGAPVILSSKIRGGSFREAAYKNNVKMLLFEGGEAMRFDEKSISVSYQGIYSFMKEIGMISKNPYSKKIIDKDKVFYAKKSYWLRSPKAGILMMNKNLGNKVREGELIGCVADIFGENKLYIHAKDKGIIIGMAVMPLVINGDAVVHIASD